MPPQKPKTDAVTEEDEAKVVDDTETTAPEVTEDDTPVTNDPADTTEGAEEGTDADQTDEASPEDARDETSDEAPEPSVEELSASSRIKKLEDEIATLKGAAAPAAATATAPVSHIEAFVKQKAPELKRKFTDDTATLSDQFDATYEMSSHLVKSVLDDHVFPFHDRISRRVILLQNEVEIRDLRDTGSVFTSLERDVRAILKKTRWNERAALDDHGRGIVTKIYHQLLGQRNGSRLAAATTTPRGTASAALRDVSVGRGAPAKKSAGVTLTAEQESDFQALLSEGMDLTREQYAAKYKARAEKAKAAGRPIPKTFRSFR